MIRELGKTILEQANYHVLEAKDGLEAVQTFTQHAEEIGLVILDMMMPRLSGRDAAEQINQLKPNIKILLSSGYTSDDVGEVAGVHTILAKPYRPNDLLLAVQEALLSH
jgi:CheY-like chemotaxis protein